MKVAVKRILNYLGNGILVGGVTYMGLQTFEQYYFPKSHAYQTALHLVIKHPEAIKYLGEPITDEYIDLDLSKNYKSSNSCYFSVPLKGPKATGTMRYLVNITDNKSMNYNIAEIELIIANEEKTKINISQTPISIHKQ